MGNGMFQLKVLPQSSISTLILMSFCASLLKTFVPTPVHSFQLTRIPAYYLNSPAMIRRRSTRIRRTPETSANANTFASRTFSNLSASAKVKEEDKQEQDTGISSVDADAEIATSTTIGTPKKRKISRKMAKPKSPPRSPPRKSAAPKIVLCSNDLAKISPQNQWKDLKIAPEELRPSATLTTGQCFNWMVVHDFGQEGYVHNPSDGPSQPSSAWGTHNETEWIGPVQDYILSIKETPSTTLYRVLHGPNANGDSDGDGDGDQDLSEFLYNYFQLSTPLEPLYKSWSANDERLSKIAPVIPGLRIIRQDPIECMFSFICSSNNNIPRITKMLAAFRKAYGRKMMDLPVRMLNSDGDSASGNISELLDEPMAIHTFPTLEELRISTEEELRDIGLGYRAKYIIQTRDLLIENGGKEYLLNLRTKDAPTVQEALLQFSGIGRKVADCVALFSLDQCEAIPVDIHVQHIASRDYDPSVLGGAKSLTPTIYNRVGDLFRDRFEYAGWAHSLLFVAELPSFRNVLPDDIVAEMDAWREAELARKAEAKEAKKKKSLEKQ